MIPFLCVLTATGGALWLVFSLLSLDASQEGDEWTEADELREDAVLADAIAAWKESLEPPPTEDMWRAIQPRLAIYNSSSVAGIVKADTTVKS